MEGADDVETTACDGEHSEHDAEGQDCLYTEEVSFEEEEGDGLGGTSHGTGMSQKLGWQLRSRKRADQFYAVTGLGVFFVLRRSEPPPLLDCTLSCSLPLKSC